VTGEHGSAVHWLVDRRSGPAAQLHALDLLSADAPGVALTRRLVRLEPTAPAVVLGSTQASLFASVSRAPGEVRSDEGAGGPGGDVDLVLRHSGGGAVMLEPGGVLWVDVVVPRGDPLWVDDVSTGALWLGAAWVSALASLGVAATVYRGPVDRSQLARAVCFAGRAPGEVIAADGRKVVGISQRRTRTGARFQCVLYTEVPSSAALASVVASTVEGGAGIVAEALAGHVAHVEADAEVVFEAMRHAVAAAGPISPDSGGIG
jgi:lipoate-protein ligase A